MSDTEDIEKVTIYERDGMAPRVIFDPVLVGLASEWHGGQSSMLYALASTGDLRMNDRWFKTNGKRQTYRHTADLCYHLYCEVVEHCLPHAETTGHELTRADIPMLVELSNQALTAAAHLWPEEYDGMLKAEPDGYEPAGDSMLME